MLKIREARLQQYMNWQFPDVQMDLEKQEESVLNCQHLLDHRKSKRIPEKHILLLYWLCKSLWLCEKWKLLSCVRLFVTLWNSPGQNTGVGSLFLLQGIFLTQGSKLALPNCRQILYQLSHQGSPFDCVDHNYLWKILKEMGIPDHLTCLLRNL